jgi:hypothetical protein
MSECSPTQTCIRALTKNSLMKTFAGRSLDNVRDTFYEGPASQVRLIWTVMRVLIVNQNGRRIFYYIAARIGLVDYDLLAYHIFTVSGFRSVVVSLPMTCQILSGVTEPFDVIVDLTDFSPSHEVPATWLRRVLQICPATIVSLANVSSIHLSTERIELTRARPSSFTIPTRMLANESVVFSQTCHPSVSLHFAVVPTTLLIVYSSDIWQKPCGGLRACGTSGICSVHQTGIA